MHWRLGSDHCSDRLFMCRLDNLRLMHDVLACVHGLHGRFRDCPHFRCRGCGCFGMLGMRFVRLVSYMSLMRCVPIMGFM